MGLPICMRYAQVGDPYREYYEWTNFANYIKYCPCNPAIRIQGVPGSVCKLKYVTLPALQSRTACSRHERCAAGTREQSEESQFSGKNEILRRSAAQNDIPKIVCIHVLKLHF